MIRDVNRDLDNELREKAKKKLAAKLAQICDACDQPHVSKWGDELDNETLERFCQQMMKVDWLKVRSHHKVASNPSPSKDAKIEPFSEAFDIDSTSSQERTE